jgi:hypothetical protein
MHIDELRGCCVAQMGVNIDFIQLEAPQHAFVDRQRVPQ